MKKYLVVLAACVLLAACDEKAVSGGEDGGGALPTSPSSPVASACPVTWGRDVNVAAPFVKLVPSRVVDAILLTDFDWNFEEEFRGPFVVFERELRHHRYTVQAKIGACLSDPWPLEIAPNTDSSGSSSRPPNVPGPTFQPWGDCTATVFTSGVAVGWDVDMPAGRYRATVLAKDHNHGPDYQVGQRELLDLELTGPPAPVGTTDDIPDLSKEHPSTFEFTTSGARGVRLASRSGSVHGACVSIVAL